MTDPAAALLIIDVQLDVVCGERPAARLPAVLANLNQAIAKARERGYPVVFVQHEEPGMEHGSPGWALHPALSPETGDLFVSKRFGDSFCSTSLAALLGERGIGHVWVGGCATDFCIDSTVRNAVSRGLQVTVIGDAHTTVSAFELSGEQVIDHFNAVWQATSATPQPLNVVRASAL